MRQALSSKEQTDHKVTQVCFLIRRFFTLGYDGKKRDGAWGCKFLKFAAVLFEQQQKCGGTILKESL